MDIEERLARVGSANVYYQAAGRYGPPLLLIHGLSGSGRWWARNVSVLARHYKVYIIDLLGFGRGAGQPFELCGTAGLLRDWMDALDLERVDVVGHSMGGLIAADLAATAPERVDRLVLVDAAAVPIGRSYSRHALGLARSLRHTPLDFLPMLVADAWRAGPSTLWKALQEMTTTDIREDLARIAAPSLIVWGEHDTLIPVKLGRRLQHYLPRAEFEVIKGAGHNPMWDRPLQFNQAVLGFLARNEMARASAALARTRRQHLTH